MRRNNKGMDLGPIVGYFMDKEIRANQLKRKDDNWDQGYGTPSDGFDTNKDSNPVRKLTKTAKEIIIYWSRSGSTELLASKIYNNLLDADVFQIQLETPYPANYLRTLDRAEDERLSENHPRVVEDLPDLSQYDRIYLGFQTWAMTLSQPLQGFLSQYGQEFKNKTILPFETEGSYGAGNSIYTMKNLIEKAGGGNNRFAPTLVVDGNRVDEADAEIKYWVEKTKKF